MTVPTRSRCGVAGVVAIAAVAGLGGCHRDFGEARCHGGLPCATGDPCSTEGALLPCEEGRSDCDMGCRSCTGGRWTQCGGALCGPSGTNTCGDGEVLCGEACDDGNTAGADGCQPDRTVQPGWQCDDSEPSLCDLDQFVTVPPGTFTMGSPAAEAGRSTWEVEHTVTLTRAFSLSTTDLPQRDFVGLMGWNPSSYSGCDDCPVERVSWYDAAAYTNQLTLQQGGTPCYVFSNVACVDATVPAPSSNYMACQTA